MVPKTDSGKWQIAFWIMTGLVLVFFSASITGYFKLDAKIVSAEDRITQEKKEDVAKIEHRIEKLDEKIEIIKTEQSAMRQENNEKFTNILIVLEQIKAQQIEAN